MKSFLKSRIEIPSLISEQNGRLASQPVGITKLKVCFQNTCIMSSEHQKPFNLRWCTMKACPGREKIRDISQDVERIVTLKKSLFKSVAVINLLP